MADRPPQLDYRTPPSPPTSARKVLLWWSPPLLAVILSLLILKVYGNVAAIPRRLYPVQQYLLIGAFWWIVLAVTARIALKMYRWKRSEREANQPTPDRS